ncbi:uncharacterized protein LOC141631904 [Silene latifolia]|uniref:uncharacterized protein LOC141631904 n=1 Tax=Silene latifolia TaxID=37657 RepID=UPI003D77DFB5
MEENVDVQFGEIQRETWLSDDEDPDESNSSLEGSGCDMNFEFGDGSDDMSDKSWGDVFRGDEQEGGIYENFDEDIPDETDEDPDETDLEDTSVVLEKLKDSEMPLYSSCKHSKLAAIVKLYNLKATNGWSDKSFTDLLELLKDMLPEDNVLPNHTYEAKKILRGIDMKYEKIHACPNDCILYRKDYANLTSFPVCKEWRYKKKEGILAKVLWYFPIIPRLIRLFANKEDAKLLTWHRTSKANDGKLRHPADGIDWKFIDEKYPEFGKESRNLRLALSTDGMNPFGNLSSQHSTWPVFLAIYNLPPYLCMKRKYLMLSLFISGPKEPGHDIDVYLEPLLDDLRLLWDKGIQVFDAYQNSYFNLKAMLLCTISDFPAYGNLCGHTVHGKEACPLCGEDVDSCYLKFSRKQAYTGCRRFLEHDHSYRRHQKAFNGKPEHRPPPKILTGHEVYQRVKDIKITYGKKGSKLASRGYKKISPLFEKLPYWRDLSIRHCLDVMHIEKNVCDNIINTLLNVPNKSKDNTTTRKDMVDMKIRPELAPQEKGTRSYLPPAAHTLSRKEKIEFCECLRGVKVPEGYSSNISTLVSMKDLRLIGLKSHDCHTLMQQLLVVAIRSILPKKVRYAITRFCFFFNAICNKVLDPTELESLQKLIVTSLCQLEMYFLPSFFIIMVHLTVHLVREIKYIGPVYLTYQYHFERLMKVYKDYTSNKYRPEGCIAERAITDEALSYCYTHLSNSELIGVPKNRHSEWMMGKGLRGHVRQDMTTEKWHIAHTYVLHNEDEVQPYIEEHMVSLREKHRNKTKKWISSEHNKTFRVWFKARVIEDLQQYPDCISSRLRRLCFGPKTFASSYSGYAIKGCTFYTREQDDMSTMQNSGVCVEAEAMHFASSKDKNPVLSKMHYYGVIEEIWELDYTDFVIPIFGCKWIDNNNGDRKDELGFTLVNLGKFGHKEDPFIIGTQAKQVFYVTDPSDKKWSLLYLSEGVSAHFRIVAMTMWYLRALILMYHG